MARGFLLTPAGFGQYQHGLRELLDGLGAVEPVVVGAGVDDLEPRYRGTDFEAVVVDGQRDQAGIDAAGPNRFRERARVLPPAHWSVTFAPDEADATAAKALELGGRVIVPPFDAPWTTRRAAGNRGDRGDRS